MFCFKSRGQTVATCGELWGHRLWCRPLAVTCRQGCWLLPGCWCWSVHVWQDACSSDGEDIHYSLQPSQWLRGITKENPPVVHLPQLRSHPQLPHAHQPLTPTAHDLPVVRLHRRDAQMVGIEWGHRGGGSQVEDPDPESQQRETSSLFWNHEIYQTCD